MYWLTKITKHKMALGILASIVLGIMLLPAVPAFAEDPEETKIDFGVKYGEATGLGNQDVRTTVSKIINVALGLLGIVAVVIMLVGGFEWMTAGGDDEKVGTAKKRIFAGILGLAIILSAYAIARFVLEQLYIATTGETSYTEEGLE